MFFRLDAAFIFPFFDAVVCRTARHEQYGYESSERALDNPPLPTHDVIDCSPHCRPFEYRFDEAFHMTENLFGRDGSTAACGRVEARRAYLVLQTRARRLIFRFSKTLY
jgi:hypothetical protein